MPGLFFRKPSGFKGRPAISEFDQEDGYKNQTADDDVNLEQHDRVAAEPKSRVNSDCAEQHNPRSSSYAKKIGLVLQGGGALGSYQAGVYEALASSEYLPDWVAGISIGAINAAIIVGNAPANRVKRLRSFWEEVTAHTNLLPFALFSSLAGWQQKSGALTALMFGQPGFFIPRSATDWLSPGTLVSYYDTSVLKGSRHGLRRYLRNWACVCSTC